MAPAPDWTAVVLAGGRAARLGGQAKPQLEVGGRTILAAVLDAVAGAASRVVVGPPQPVPDGVLVVRERPPGGGPVPALRTGLAHVGTDLVVVLAGDLPFVTAEVVGQLRGTLAADGVEAADGVLVVDDAGRDQYLLGAWRTAALRTALRTALQRVDGPRSLRGALAPLAVRRLRPRVAPGRPAPWTDCDTPAELARARAAVAGAPGG